MANPYGGLLDPESQKWLRSQALLNFGANLLAAQPTPYPQGFLSNVGGALSNTLPMISNQALLLAESQRRKQRDEAEEAERRRKESQPVISGGMVFDKQGKLLADYRQAPQTNNRPYVVGGALVSPTGDVIYKAPANEMTPYQQRELELRSRGLDIEQKKLEQGGIRGQIGSVSPDAYTPESIAEFAKTGDYKVLKRYATSLDVEGQAAVAAAKKSGTITGEAQGKAKSALPLTMQGANYTIDLVNKLVNHPGLSASVGLQGPTAWAWGGKPIPGTASADFNSLKDQISGRAFLEAYQNVLKGGGQITEIEGQKATVALSRMQNAQSEDEFKGAAAEFMDAVSKIRDITARIATGDFQPQASDRISVDGAVQVQTPADVEALPSGTVFITPDGRRKVKP